MKTMMAVLALSAAPAWGASARQQLAQLAPQTAPVEPSGAAAPSETTPPSSPAVRTWEQVVAGARPAVLQILAGNSSGSGVILTPEGLAVTNAHVVGRASKGDILAVRLVNGMMVRAKVLGVGGSGFKDVAFLQLPERPAEAGPWPHAPVSDPALTEEVVAIGYPMGLSMTVTKGIVSGIGGNRPQLLQTDAAINRGNSGGPLFDKNGAVIGINTSIVSPGMASGLGFAIPAVQVRAYLKELMESGAIRMGWAGMVFDTNSREMRRGGVLIEKPIAPGVPVATLPGVRVEHVRKGSPAEAAGIMPGDFIAGVGERMFPPSLHPKAAQENLMLLKQLISGGVPGSALPLIVIRGEEKGQVELVIGSRTAVPDTEDE